MAFETLFDASNGTIYKFENKGDQLEGYFMGSFDYQGDYGPTKRHVFSTPEGAVIVFGQKHLMQLLPQIKVGTMVRLTYIDDLAPKKKGQHPMKLFKPEQDRKNVIEVNGVELAPALTETTEDDVPSNFEPVTEEPIDEAPPARATRPATPARTPSAAQQAAVRSVLSAKR